MGISFPNVASMRKAKTVFPRFLAYENDDIIPVGKNESKQYGLGEPREQMITTELARWANVVGFIWGSQADKPTDVDRHIER